MSADMWDATTHEQTRGDELGACTICGTPLNAGDLAALIDGALAHEVCAQQLRLTGRQTRTSPDVAG